MYKCYILSDRGPHLHHPHRVQRYILPARGPHLHHSHRLVHSLPLPAQECAVAHECGTPGGFINVLQWGVAGDLRGQYIQYIYIALITTGSSTQ